MMWYKQIEAAAYYYRQGLLLPQEYSGDEYVVNYVTVNPHHTMITHAK